MIMKSTESGTVKWKSLENYEIKSSHTTTFLWTMYYRKVYTVEIQKYNPLEKTVKY